MAGMAEMAQMAAVLKYKRGLQCQNNTKVVKSTKKSLVVVMQKNGESSPYKPKQCRWRNLIAGFVHKANKSLCTHEKKSHRKM